MITFGSGSSFTSLGNNIFDDASVTSVLASDQVNTDPLLGPLADNGGPTPTHALLSGSTAIDAGNNSLALNIDNSVLTTDQRGETFDRIQFDTVDIGAFESSFDDSFLLGDVNIDGAVNFFDISPFISLLASGNFVDQADTNRDGSVNFGDINNFISLLSSGGAPISSPSTAAATASGSAASSKAFVAKPDVVSEASTGFGRQARNATAVGFSKRFIGFSSE